MIYQISQQRNFLADADVVLMMIGVIMKVNIGLKRKNDASRREMEERELHIQEVKSHRQLTDSKCKSSR